ncbi:acetyl-CoA synthetase-like protein, partial [Anaeromyces robustus]
MLTADTTIKYEKEFISNFNASENDKLYHEEISKIAQLYPDKCAIVFNETKFTYKELDEMTNSLAYYLRKQNVNRNDIIPIISNRSPYYIIGTLGVSKAGGAYLPIDPKLPIDRIQLLLNECQPKLVLFNNIEDIIDKLNINKTEFIYCNLKNHNYSQNIGKIDNINESNDLSYVLFTSGSTGEPKGTLINHYNLYNFVRSYKKNSNEYCMYDVLNENNVKTVLSISNFSFCTSNVDNIVSLIHGLKVVLADDIVSNDITLLSKYITDNNVDFFIITPTRLNLFLENDLFRNSLDKVKAICLAGEKLSFELCRKIRKYSNCNIYNTYGLTECTAVCSCKKIIVNNDNNKDDIITIGKPLSSCKIYILDQNMKSVPIGVEGEIYIGGYTVGDGYLHHEEWTKAKYIKNPFNTKNDLNEKHNQIIIKTGDLGKWTNNGEIEYLGRMDSQVKIHGQRIELGEIESKIHEIDGIDQCIVIDKVKKETNEKYLMCYYTLTKENKNKVESNEIREYLKKKLPL